MGQRVKLVERTERSLTVLLRILVTADMNRESDSAISRGSMSAPMPTGSPAGGRGTAFAMGGTEKTSNIFTDNLCIVKIRCLGFPPKFCRCH